jgi:hypothetical protein
MPTKEATVDPAVDLFDTAPATGGPMLKLDVLFHGRRQALDALARAYGRGVPLAELARLVEQATSEKVSPTTVKSWLDANKIKR